MTFIVEMNYLEINFAESKLRVEIENMGKTKRTKPGLVEVFHARALPCAPIVCSVGHSQNTVGGVCPLLLFASANLRKYNHSLLVQLPAELQTQAVSRRIFQTLQIVGVCQKHSDIAERV